MISCELTCDQTDQKKIKQFTTRFVMMEREWNLLPTIGEQDYFVNFEQRSLFVMATAFPK